MSKFRVSFTPQRLSYLSQLTITKNLWTHSQIRKSMKLMLTEFLKQTNVDDSVDLLQCDIDSKILHQVLQNVSKLPLPSDLKTDLKTLIKNMEFVIWNWLDTVYYNGNLLLDLENYLDYIKWTKDGDIDSAETLRAMYLSGILPDGEDTWVKLTSYCLEDCITNYFERVQVTYSPSEPKVFDILPLYWTRRFQNRLEDFSTELRSIIVFADLYEDSESLNVNLFRVSVLNLNHPAAMHFWASLTDDQIIRTINKYVQKRVHVTEETAVFLWKQVAVHGVDDFLIMVLGQRTVMRRLVTWPYDDLLTRTLEESEFGDEDLEKMALCICATITYDPWSSEHYEEYKAIFKRIWRRIGEEHKKSMDCFDYVICFAKDVEMLGYLIGDPGMASRRRYLVEQVASHYRLIHHESDIREVIDRFCEVVLQGEEREAFQRRFDDILGTIGLEELGVEDFGN